MYSPSYSHKKLSLSVKAGCNLVWFHQMLSAACPGIDGCLCLPQDIPPVPQSAKYEGKVKPDKVDWDKIIKGAVEAGKEVPEIDWCKPGVDAALEVSFELAAHGHNICQAC